MKHRFSIQILCVFVSVLLFSCHNCRGKPKIYQTTLCGHLVSLEVANTSDQRRQGLMGRTFLKKDHGIIFVFKDDRIRSFWMKNCVISLSIAYFDAYGQIMNSHEMNPEPLDRPDHQLKRYRSIRPARYVIEMNQNWFADKTDCVVDLSFLETIGDSH